MGWDRERRLRSRLDLGGGALARSEGAQSFVAKLAPDGSHRWSLMLPGGTSTVTSVSTDNARAIYVGGYVSHDGPMSTSQPFVAKLDAGGAPLWTENLTAGTQNEGVILATNPCGGVRVVSNWSDTVRGYAVFEVAESGKPGASYLGPGDDTRVASIASDLGGGLYLAGDRLSGPNTREAFVAHWRP